MTFNFKNCLEKHGFIADFDNTSEICDIMEIDERENPDWFDDYYESLEAFAREHRLTEFVFCVGDTNEHADIFFASDIDAVIRYIKATDRDYDYDNEVTLTIEEIKDCIKISQPFPTVKELCKTISVPQSYLSVLFGIPLRTIESWAGGKRKPPEYVLRMMLDVLRLKYHYKEIKPLDCYY